MPQHVTIASQGLLKQAAVSVGTAPTLLTAGVVGANPPTLSSTKDRKNITLFNNGTTTIFLGDASVTTVSGHPVLAQTGFSADYGGQAALYGICAAGTNDVRVLESY